MPELRKQGFSDFKIVCPDEVSFNFLPFVRGIDLFSLGVGKERACSGVSSSESRDGGIGSPAVHKDRIR
jgi:hypothetical protein